MTARGVPLRSVGARMTPQRISEHRRAIDEFLERHAHGPLNALHLSKLANLLDDYALDQYRRGFMEAPRHDYR